MHQLSSSSTFEKSNLQTFNQWRVSYLRIVIRQACLVPTESSCQNLENFLRMRLRLKTKNVWLWRYGYSTVNKFIESSPAQALPSPLEEYEEVDHCSYSLNVAAKRILSRS